MSFSSGTAILAWQSFVTLESSGATVSSGAISSAATTSVTSTQHQDAPLVEVTAAVTFGTNPTAGNTVVLAYTPLTVDGTSTHDTNASNATNYRPLGSDFVAATTSEQYLDFGIQATPSKEFDLRLLNQTDQAFTWKLYLRPVSTIPHA